MAVTNGRSVVLCMRQRKQGKADGGGCGMPLGKRFLAFLWANALCNVFDSLWAMVRVLDWVGCMVAHGES